MPDVVLGKEVPDWWRIFPLRPETRLRQERGECPDESSRWEG